MISDLYTDDGRKVTFWRVPYGSRLPQHAGLYAIWSARELIYIGKAENLDDRIGSGWSNHEKNWAFSLMGATNVAYAQIANALLRDDLERALIRGNSPPLNVQHNWLAGPDSSLLGGLFGR